jgi:hypothetical protein
MVFTEENSELGCVLTVYSYKGGLCQTVIFVVMRLLCQFFIRLAGPWRLCTQNRDDAAKWKAAFRKVYLEM